jgi:hypothetical protein
MKKTIIFRGSVVFPKHPQNFLKNSIESIRKWFDGEIIVSTWKGQEQNLNEINDIDKVVLSEDPGEGPVQQINRQIVSFRNGLESSNSDLILVTRTDVIHNINIFDFFDIDKKTNDILKIFENKITIGNMMSIIPGSYEHPSNFRLGDWFHLGKINDLDKWSDISDIVNSNDISNLQCTEQIWSLSVIKKQLKILNSLKDYNEIEKYSWEYILNNFSIWNTKSDLKSENLNWKFQPEFINSYITRELYLKQLKNQ